MANHLYCSIYTICIRSHAEIKTGTSLILVFLSHASYFWHIYYMTFEVFLVLIFMKFQILQKRTLNIYDQYNLAMSFCYAICNKFDFATNTYFFHYTNKNKSLIQHSSSFIRIYEDGFQKIRFLSSILYSVIKTRSFCVSKIYVS